MNIVETLLKVVLEKLDEETLKSIQSNIQSSLTTKSDLFTKEKTKINLLSAFEENKKLQPLFVFFTLKELFLKEPTSFEKTLQKNINDICSSKTGFDLKLFKKLLKFISSSFHEMDTKKHYVIDVSDTTSFTSNLHVQAFICTSFLSVFDDNYSYFPNEEEDFSLSMEIGEYINMIRYCCDSNISNKNILIDFLAVRFLDEKYDNFGASFNSSIRGIIMYYGPSSNWDLVINANMRTVSYYLNLCEDLKTDRDKDNNYNVEADKFAYAYIEMTMRYYKDILKEIDEIDKLWREFLPKIRTMYKTEIIYYYLEHDLKKAKELINLIETNLQQGFYTNHKNAYHTVEEIKEYIYWKKKSLTN